MRILILLVFFFSREQHSFAQVTYPDSCLKVEFCFKNGNDKLDTVKNIKVKKGENIYNSVFWNEKAFNLVVLFRNVCDQRVAVPGEVLLGVDFWGEGVRIDSGKVDTVKLNIAVDYMKDRKGADEIILAPMQHTVLPYNFPLAYNINQKGTYKFRLVFYNSYNYIPFNEWKTYYSNWIYLKLF